MHRSETDDHVLSESQFIARLSCRQSVDMQLFILSISNWGICDCFASWVRIFCPLKCKYKELQSDERANGKKKRHNHKQIISQDVQNYKTCIWKLSLCQRNVLMYSNPNFNIYARLWDWKGVFWDSHSLAERDFSSVTRIFKVIPK